MRKALILVGMMLTGCWGEFETHPQFVTRRDPCTKVVERKTIYLYPECPSPSPALAGAGKEPPHLIPGR
jgi:hypothetical protein